MNWLLIGANTIAAFTCMVYVVAIVVEMAKLNSKNQLLLSFFTAGVVGVIGYNHFMSSTYWVQNLDSQPSTMHTFFVVASALWLIAWLVLRMQLLWGGKGDRLIKPQRLATKLMTLIYIGTFATVIYTSHSTGEWAKLVPPNIIIFFMYMIISLRLMLTQWYHNKWSVSGIAVAGYFLNAGFTAAAVGWHAFTGLYGYSSAGWYAKWALALAAMMVVGTFAIETQITNLRTEIAIRDLRKEKTF